MNHHRTIIFLAAAILATNAAAPARAGLTAREVLIVANAGVEDSVELAKLYAARRGIDANQIVLLRMSGGSDVTRENYDKLIADPIRKALQERGLREQIRCICTIYGVPYRVHGPADDPAAKLFLNVKRDVSKMHYQLAINRTLLATVGVKFPQPRIEGIKPLSMLFDPRVEVPGKPLPSIASLRADIGKLLNAKQAQVAKIADPGHRKIAQRQLMAMHFESRGYKGLIEHLRQTRPDSKSYVKQLQKQLDQAEKKLKDMQGRQVSPEGLTTLIKTMRTAGGLLKAVTYIEQLKGRMSERRIVRSPIAAVDSELALLNWPKYPLHGPTLNPLHWRARTPAGVRVVPTLMVSRLDGPSRADVARMIEDSVRVEKTGLTGRLYVDAGGPPNVSDQARRAYDAKLGVLADFASKHTELKVVYDRAPIVFPKGTCPDAALYVGWYSLKKYVDAFKWQPGAVGWHVASWEAVHLRDPKCSEWCAKMIQNGVAATLGAVREPLLMAFPEPAEYMALLMTGQYTVAECYWRTIPNTSWQMMMLADPLYNPFKAKPLVKVSDLPAKLAP